MSRKVYVAVTAKFDTDGNIIPLSVTWKDGTIFYVSKVLDIRAASLKAGGQGIRYLCRFGNREAFFMKNHSGSSRGRMGSIPIGKNIS